MLLRRHADDGPQRRRGDGVEKLGLLKVWRGRKTSCRPRWSASKASRIFSMLRPVVVFCATPRMTTAPGPGSPRDRVLTETYTCLSSLSLSPTPPLCPSEANLNVSAARSRKSIPRSPPGRRPANGQQSFSSLLLLLLYST